MSQRKRGPFTPTHIRRDEGYEPSRRGCSIPTDVIFLKHEVNYSNKSRHPRCRQSKYHAGKLLCNVLTIKHLTQITPQTKAKIRKDIHVGAERKK